jgi:hypothetical protein
LFPAFYLSGIAHVFALRTTLFAGDIVLTSGFLLLRIPPVGWDTDQ